MKKLTPFQFFSKNLIILKHKIYFINKGDTKFEKAPGLNMFVNFHRIIEITYMGWTADQNQSKRKKALLIIWNFIILIGLTFGITYSLRLIIDSGQTFKVEGVSGAQIIENIQNNTKKSESILVQVLFKFGIFSYNFQTLFICLFQIIFGSKLLNNLNTIDVKIEANIGKLLVITQIVVIVLTIAPVLCTLKSFFPNMGFKDIIFQTLLNFFVINAMTSIMALTAFKCLTVKQQLKRVFQMNVSNDLEIVYKYVHKIHISIKDFDNYISIYLFVSLFANLMISVSSICHLALNPNLRFIQTLLTIMFGLSQIFILCLICNVIPKSLRKLIDRIEENISKGFDSYKPNDRQIIIHLKSLIPEMGFTAFGLFQINANTFLSCLALIVSYSVIIIQTKTIFNFD